MRCLPTRHSKRTISISMLRRTAMTSLSDIAPLSPEQRASYGVARAKSIAFDAVHALWRRRRAEGKSQAELAKVLGKDEGWLSKNLRGPGNWTMRTLGELVEALD